MADPRSTPSEDPDAAPDESESSTEASGATTDGADANDERATDADGEAPTPAPAGGTGADDTEPGPDDAEPGPDDAEPPDDAELSTEELRARVEAEYDFDDFGPEDMARMSQAEWEAVFDPDSWITGTALLDRVEADLKAAVVRRDVFARIERLADPDRIVAYSDEGYAVVYEDGSVEGRGTVRRDVEPVVALCSMEEYDPDEMPEGDLLPDPMEVPEGSGERGNLMLQVVAAVQGLAGLVLLGGGFLALTDPSNNAAGILFIAGLGFIGISFLLFFTVANARLSDKFRAEEYRNRLRAVGVDAEDRPEFMDRLVEEHPELVEGEGDREGEGTA